MREYGIQKMWFVGRGFYAASLVNQEAAAKLVGRESTLYRGNVVHVMPYTPSFMPYTLSFRPEEELKARCPVWVCFLACVAS